MTSSDIRLKLIEHFHKLIEVENWESELYGMDDNGHFKNVSYPNERFTIPDDKYFYELSVMNGTPSPISLGQDAPTSHNGIFQIDVCTPTGNGTIESDDRKEVLFKLFKRGIVIGDSIEVTNVYSPTESSEGDFYRTVVRVEYNTVI